MYLFSKTYSPLSVILCFNVQTAVSHPQLRTRLRHLPLPPDEADHVDEDQVAPQRFPPRSLRSQNASLAGLLLQTTRQKIAVAVLTEVNIHHRYKLVAI